MNKNKKILLVTPPYHTGVVESAGTWLNVGFVYIAGSLREAGYEVRYYDAMSYFHSAEDIRKTIEDYKPDAVATTAFTSSLPAAVKLLGLAKSVNPGIVTVLGNVHVTFMWEETLSRHHGEVDYLVRGEGELTLPELFDCHFSGGDIASVKGVAWYDGTKPVTNGPRPFIEDLDSLPMAWDLVDWSIYSYRPVKDSVLAIISTSRGCTSQCSFCSQQLFWGGRWRARSAEHVVGELEYLNRTYGVNVAMFADETPTLDRVRWERILDLMIERNVKVEILMETRVSDILRDEDILWKYKKAGVAHIYVGVESVSQFTLDAFKKDVKLEDSKKAIALINAQDIVSETSFVLGMPDDTVESIRNTIELAKHYGPDLGFFLAIAPWPYADIYPVLEPYIATTDYSKYNLIEPVVKPVNMTLQELRHELMNASRQFYMDKLSKLDSMTPYKRNFMLSVMKLMMDHSYLAGEIKGAMPPEIRKHIEKIGIISPIP